MLAALPSARKPLGVISPYVEELLDLLRQHNAWLQPYNGITGTTSACVLEYV